MCCMLKLTVWVSVLACLLFEPVPEQSVVVPSLPVRDTNPPVLCVLGCTEGTYCTDGQ